MKFDLFSSENNLLDQNIGVLLIILFVDKFFFFQEYSDSLCQVAIIVQTAFIECPLQPQCKSSEVKHKAMICHYNRQKSYGGLKSQ